MGCIKCLLFIFNLTFFLAGLGLIIAGSLALTALDQYFVFLGGSLPGFTEFILVVGAVIFIIAFFGCCGAFKENYCMILTFSLLMVIVFIMEIGGAIGAYVARDDISGLITAGMEDTMDLYEQDGQQAITSAWIKMQSRLECCGTYSPMDWNSTTYGEIPPSCYADDGTAYSDGCLETLAAWAMSNLAAIGGALIGLVVIQMLGICISCSLAKEVKRVHYDKV